MNKPELPERRSATGLYLGLGAACAVFMVLPFALGPQFADAIDGLIVQAQRGHIGFPVAIAFFTLASFIGAPQPLMVGACVLAAGAWDGFLYAWAGTTAAGVANYYVGRAFHRYARERIDGFARWKWMRLIQRKPFVSSLLIRSVPTAPFVVVNMAFGAGRASPWGFVLGLVLGSIPKIAIIAFAGKGVRDVIQGDIGWGVVVAAAVVGVWVLIGIYLRRRAEKIADNENF